MATVDYFLLCSAVFRDPQRIAALGRDLVLSPADGRIVVVEKPMIHMQVVKHSRLACS